LTETALRGVPFRPRAGRGAASCRRRPEPHDATSPKQSRAEGWLIGLLALILWLAFRPCPAWAASVTPSDGGPFLTYLPLLQGSEPVSLCPATSNTRYLSVLMLPPPTDRPAPQNGDLNLALRGYISTTAYLGLVNYAGSTDSDPPQMPGLVRGSRVPAITAAYRVRDWDWACGDDGCRGEPIEWPPVTLIAIGVTPGEQIYIPGRDAEVYRNEARSVVLYADERRITVKYTRDDNVVSGYTVHIEEVCVDPNLLALYRALDGGGRLSLPGLRNDDPLGVAPGDAIAVAVRDSGSFMDPRAKKDWWQIAQ
jgi:hypothetical protein